MYYNMINLIMFHYKNPYIQQYFNIDTNVLCDISEMNDKFNSLSKIVKQLDHINQNAI